jgi:hypothetical protein
MGTLRRALAAGTMALLVAFVATSPIVADDPADHPAGALAERDLGEPVPPAAATLAEVALPSPAAPRADGKLTLVWFDEHG